MVTGGEKEKIVTVLTDKAQGNIEGSLNGAQDANRK